MIPEISNTKDKRAEALYQEIISRIKKGSITDKDVLEKEKILLSRKYGVPRLIKNAEIIDFAYSRGEKSVIKFLRTKPVRTLSGVANIAVMWKGADMNHGLFFSCSEKCIYCPQGKNSPKSYTGVEPTTLRAKRHGYDPEKQVKDRLYQLRLLGHNTDKCELIIMGGTFMMMPFSFRQDFVKNCFDGFNQKKSQSLAEAHKINETAKNRCIGLTIETRADWCSQEQIEEMLSFGCTRVEVGVQTTDEELLEKTKRGHDAAANKEAFRRLKENGLKATAHWMPGLSGLKGKPDIDKELEDFQNLFTDPAYRPDELKIYPTLVMPGTELYEMWKRGEYISMERAEMIELLMKMKKIVPTYVRIKRIMRDISEHEAAAGARTTNLRQLLREKNVRCRCIRCREAGLKALKELKLELLVQKYEASGGKEYFLSFENVAKDAIVAFLRLRIDKGHAKIREVHVYGKIKEIGVNSERGDGFQHRGLGKQLIEKAEEIARQNRKEKILVTSGVGVRNYYKQLGYTQDGYYMEKTL